MMRGDLQSLPRGSADYFQPTADRMLDQLTAPRLFQDMMQSGLLNPPRPQLDNSYGSGYDA
jgi:hypothetical protein